MYRIVASDMDETFLAHDHSIPQANIDAIRRMRELGCLFVPSSGRPYRSIMHSIEAIPAELMEGSYVVSYNGGCINRYGDDRPLISNHLPMDLVRRLYDYGVSHGVGFHIYNQEGHVWGAHNVQAEHDYLRGHMPLDERDDDTLAYLEGETISKILYVLPDGLEELHAMLDAMPPELVESTDTTFSSGRYLEFNPKGVNKGAGLRILAYMLEVDIDDVIACGDSLNDLPMIEAAGVGVAARNCTDNVEKSAQLFAESTCDDGILMEVLQKVIEPAAAAE